DVSLDWSQRKRLTNLAGALCQLGDFRAEVGNASCVVDYQKAIAIFKRAGENSGEAMAEWNLGNAYKDLSQIRDLEAAESAYKRSLDLLDPNDAWGRSKCIRQIGLLYFERLVQALERKESPEILENYAQIAEENYITALSICPAEASGELSEIHKKLGNLYLTTHLLKPARKHYELAAQLEDDIGDRFRAAGARFQLALTYCREAVEAQGQSQERGNLVRARAYAEAALRDYEYYGEHAASQAQVAEELLNNINQVLSELGH
ncbi:MAG TPA: hypothetical protein VN843_08705, partial [Anaerolineales bacterium]|nr:hypothetical protein [Anaerolineales bacterium]